MSADSVVGIAPEPAPEQTEPTLNQSVRRQQRPDSCCPFCNAAYRPSSQSASSPAASPPLASQTTALAQTGSSTPPLCLTPWLASTGLRCCHAPHSHQTCLLVSLACLWVSMELHTRRCAVSVLLRHAVQLHPGARKKRRKTVVCWCRNTQLCTDTDLWLWVFWCCLLQPTFRRATLPLR